MFDFKPNRVYMINPVRLTITLGSARLKAKVGAWDYGLFKYGGSVWSRGGISDTNRLRAILWIVKDRRRRSYLN